jgi:hypothetical protein
MNGNNIQNLLSNGTHEVILAYGSFDFTEKCNFVFLVVPNRKSGIRMLWHKDFLPALKRYMKRYYSTFQNLISGMEFSENNDALTFISNRINGKNNRLWLVYNNRNFEDVNFEK